MATLALTGCNTKKENKEENKNNTTNTENKEEVNKNNNTNQEQTNKENIEQIVKNTLNAESVTIKMSQKYQGVSTEVMNAEMSNNGNLYKVNATLEEEGVSGEIYMEKNGNQATIYINSTYGWIKKTDELDQNYDFLDLLKIAEEFKEVKSDIKNTRKYEITAKNSEISKIIGEELDDEYSEVINDSTTFYVYSEGNYIKKIVLIIKYEDEQAEMHIEYSKYNETHFEIPNEVKNAKTYEQFMQEMLGNIEQKMEEQENN